MANDCLYEMKIRGKEKDVARFVKCLKADYNYNEGKPEHKHFFRIFDCYDDEYEIEKDANGICTQLVWGYCAWSVASCMRGCEDYSYYESCKEKFPDTFMGTNLKEQTKNLEVEIFSEEPGMSFSEHYYYKNGKCILDDTCDLEVVEENEDGDYEILNPHRVNKTEEFEYDFIS